MACHNRHLSVCIISIRTNLADLYEIRFPQYKRFCSKMQHVQAAMPVRVPAVAETAEIFKWSSLWERLAAVYA